MSETKKCKHCQSDIPKKAKVCPVCKKNQKNPGLVALGIIIAIIGFFLLFGKVEPSNNSDDEKKNPEYITMEEFEAIESGMTYEEVVEIIGSEGTASSESTVGDIKTAIYIWYGKDGISNANVTFQNDEVIGKAQLGLD